MGHSQAPQFKATDAVILVVYQSRSRATVDPLLTWCSHRSLGPIHGITQYQDSTRSGLLSPDPEEGLNPETRVTQSGWIPSLCLSMWLTPHTRPVSMGNEWSPLKACRKKKKTLVGPSKGPKTHRSSHRSSVSWHILAAEERHQSQPRNGRPRHRLNGFW